MYKGSQESDHVETDLSDRLSMNSCFPVMTGSVMPEKCISEILLNITKIITKVSIKITLILLYHSFFFLHHTTWFLEGSYSMERKESGKKE